MYIGTDLTRPNTWVVFFNSVICILASCLQEAMVRSIKKKFGYISLFLFTCAIPITLYNIMFSDSAPYFTLCTFGCFSVEDCVTNDQNWGNYTSLSYVFSLAFLLSAEVLSIRFNLVFIKFTSFDVQMMVKEVNDKYGRNIQKKKDDEDEDEDEESPNDTRMHAITTKVDQIDIHSDKGRDIVVDTNDPVYKFKNIRERFQNEFSNVAQTLKPIKYKK